MTTKTVYQFDRSGAYIGMTVADESPLEPGVWLMPALTTDSEPPDVGGGQIAQWNGTAWQLIQAPPAPHPAEATLAKLKDFLAANPDVAAYINQGGV